MQKAKQGPMTAIQLQEVLARANNRECDQSASSGRHGAGLYLEAWYWVTSQILGTNARPSRNPWEPWELESIQRTIRRVHEVVALED